MASDVVAASILTFEECQQAARLVAGGDGDGASALSLSVLRVTASNLEKGCHW